MRVIIDRTKKNANSFTVIDGDEMYEVRDRKTAGGWVWSCSCGRPGCEHIAASKRRLFQKHGGPVEQASAPARRLAMPGVA